eukprot:11749649-Karenia_brevis.AAC.1
MLTYLLRKPTEYSSHEFVNPELFLPIAWYTFSLYERLGQHDGAFDPRKRSETAKIPPKPVIKVKDYAFRPHALENFPLYFFTAACSAKKQLGADSLDWTVLQENNE